MSNTIEWSSGHLPYFMAFAESGQIIEPMSLADTEPRRTAIRWMRETGEDAVVAEYRYDRSDDSSEWFRTVYRTKDWTNHGG